MTNNGVTRLAYFTICSKVVFTGRQGRLSSRRPSSLAPTGARLLPLHCRFKHIKLLSIKREHFKWVPLLKLYRLYRSLPVWSSSRWPVYNHFK